MVTMARQIESKVLPLLSPKSKLAPVHPLMEKIELKELINE